MKYTNGKPIFIVYEGLDGVGKTTCAKQTANLLGARYLTTPSDLLRKYRDEIISSYASCQEASQLFYLSTVFAAANEAKASLQAGQSVVLDRYLLSTQVYANFRGSILEIDSVIEKLLLAADLTVYLEAPLPVRRRRLGARGFSSADNETATEVADTVLRHGYERWRTHPVAGKWLRFDSSMSSPEEISKAVISSIRTQEEALACSSVSR